MRGVAELERIAGHQVRVALVERAPDRRGARGRCAAGTRKWWSQLRAGPEVLLEHRSGTAPRRSPRTWSTALRADLGPLDLLGLDTGSRSRLSQDMGRSSLRCVSPLHAPAHPRPCHDNTRAATRPVGIRARDRAPAPRSSMTRTSSVTGLDPAPRGLVEQVGEQRTRHAAPALVRDHGQVAEMAGAGAEPRHAVARQRPFALRHPCIHPAAGDSSPRKNDSGHGSLNTSRSTAAIARHVLGRMVRIAIGTAALQRWRTRSSACAERT